MVVLTALVVAAIGVLIVGVTHGKRRSSYRSTPSDPTTRDAQHLDADLDRFRGDLHAVNFETYRRIRASLTEVRKPRI
jgi:hypothetical protein